MSAHTPRALGAIGTVIALALLVLSLAFPLQVSEASTLRWWQGGLPMLAGLTLLAAALYGLRPTPGIVRTAVLVALSGIGGALLLGLRPANSSVAPGAAFWMATIAVALLARAGVQRLAALDEPGWARSATSLVFGAWLLFFWELLVTAFDVPRVLLPAPSHIVTALVEQASTLAGDLVQTVLKSVVIGYLLGCGLGVGVAIAIDRLPFLQRGLLPVASLSSTIPLVGVAPIAVMWFGFDWPSKAAVIVLMTFFPALVNTLAGLESAGKLERELMYSYAAGYKRTLLDLRLPAALPFIFNALKVNSTMALIGAIVAEFFGSPTSGLGFRISTEAARMNMPLVWSAIVVSAVVGSLFYALLVQIERRVTFWHPSVRSL